MESTFRTCLWSNFGGAIDMLINVVHICPVELWTYDRKFFFLSYHTTIFLDYYLTQPVAAFKPLLPYAIMDKEGIPNDAIDDVIPLRAYSQQELCDYLHTIRLKCKKVITQTSPDKFEQVWIAPSEVELHGLCPSIVVQYSLLDILLYNLRHVQHHVAQINMLLRQKANIAVDWISHTE